METIEQPLKITDRLTINQPMGIGTWAWGDRYLWEYGKGGYTDADIQAAFDACLAGAVDFYDTAEVYGSGKSESMLGKMAAASGQSLKLASKIMPYPWRLRPRVLQRALKSSLDRLGVEKIDLYQMHWPFPPVAIERWMEEMALAYENGLIEAVGVSNYSIEQTRRAHAKLAEFGIPLASNQIEYSLLQRAPERNGLLKTCEELGVAVIAYSPLAKGLLTGKYTPENPPPGLRGARLSKKRLAEIASFNNLLRKLGENYQKSPAQIALNWTICKGTIPIPGVKNLRQTQSNLGALGWRLSEEDVQRLDSASQKLVV